VRSQEYDRYNNEDIAYFKIADVSEAVAHSIKRCQNKPLRFCKASGECANNALAVDRRPGSIHDIRKEPAPLQPEFLARHLWSIYVAVENWPELVRAMYYLASSRQLRAKLSGCKRDCLPMYLDQIVICSSCMESSAAGARANLHSAPCEPNGVNEWNDDDMQAEFDRLRFVGTTIEEHISTVGQCVEGYDRECDEVAQCPFEGDVELEDAAKGGEAFGNYQCRG
ncbi:unnamed protein product, partial [Prorocentrum cordatum]